MVAVGDLDPAAALDRIAAAFDDWAPGGHAVPAQPARRRRRFASASWCAGRCPTSHRPTSPTASSASPARDPDYYAALVMNNALGQYALGGRLGDSIRERQGMAYYVFSNLEAGRAAGPLMVRAGVSGANVERTIASIDEELRRGARPRASPPAEIDDAKLYLTGSLPRQLETNAGIAGFLLSAELHGLGIDHDRRLPGLIGARQPRRRRAGGGAAARSGPGRGRRRRPVDGRRRHERRRRSAPSSSTWTSR